MIRSGALQRSVKYCMATTSFFHNVLIKIIRVVLLKCRGFIMEKIIAKIIEKVVMQMSDGLRKELQQAIVKLQAVADQTENPWDDILVIILKVVCGVD